MCRFLEFSLAICLLSGTLLMNSYGLSLPVLQPLSISSARPLCFNLDSLSVFSGLECVPNLRES